MTMWLPWVESAGRVAVAMMLNSLWEDTLLVLAVWLVLRVARETNASTRYFSWLVTLAAAVLLPVITTIPQTTTIAGTASAANRVPASTVAHRGVPSALPQVGVRLPAKAKSASSTPNEGARFRLPQRLRLSLPAWLATVLFGAWVVVALAIAGRLSYDLYLLERLKRDSMPLPFEFRDQMERWVRAAYGSSRDVRLCVSEHIEVPVAVGLFDSMILLPKHLLDQLSEGELDRISLHELAHLRRADDWTNSIQRFAQILFFFNPAIRYIGAQLDLEREVACDDWVLALTGEVRPYATCLTKMAELTAWPHRALAAPGVFITRKGISIRIERLLNKHRNARVNVAYGVPSLVGVALLAFFVLANVVTPVIAYTAESATSTVANVSQRIATVTQLKHVKSATPAIVRPEPTSVVAVAATPTPTPTSVVKKTVKVVNGRTVTVKSRVHQTHADEQHYIWQPHYVDVSPTDVHVPEVNVHVPEVHVHVPEVNVHVPEVNVHVPAVHVHIPRNVYAMHDRHGFSCTGCNFEGTNWAGKDMSNRSFVGANFARANLQGTNFSGSNLSGVNFDHSDLRNANFTGANLSGCNMGNADIRGAIFTGARFSGCSGVDVRTMDQAQLRAWLNQCSGCNFEGADLHGMDLRGIRMSGMNLDRANLQGADLSNASLSGVNLSGANLSGARLHGTRFSGCNFDHTDLRGVDLSDASLSGSDLSSAIMR